jgi:Icc-related predicted phosphoesterase
MTNITCISDLHGEYPELEGGDLLIIAGDIAANDSDEAWTDSMKWMVNQKYSKIVFIAGNHDNRLIGYDLTDQPFFNNFYIKYLFDSGTEFEIDEEIEVEHKFRGMIKYKGKRKFKIWGSPWTKTFEGMNPHCKAFTVDTDEELADKWNLIPRDIDILITHCPPYGILDEIYAYPEPGMKNVGSKSLRNLTTSGDYFPRKRLHVFGHIHAHGGKMIDLTMSRFINASIMDENYDPVNKPFRVIL